MTMPSRALPLLAALLLGVASAFLVSCGAGPAGDDGRGCDAEQQRGEQGQRAGDHPH